MSQGEQIAASRRRIHRNPALSPAVFYIFNLLIVMSVDYLTHEVRLAGGLDDAGKGLGTGPGQFDVDKWIGKGDVYFAALHHFYMGIKGVGKDLANMETGSRC